MKRTAFNSDSGLGVTFQLKNGRFLGLGLGDGKVCINLPTCMTMYEYSMGLNWMVRY